MTPAARFQAAIEVLSDWQSGLAAEQALSRWARGARYAGSKDRRAVRDHVYDVLRQKGVCAQLGGAETPRAWVLGLTRLMGGDVEALFSGATYAPEALTADEAAQLANPSTIDRWRDVPVWLHGRVAEDLDAAAEEVLEAMALRAPLYLRVNRAKTTVVAARDLLAEEGIEATSEAACPTALRVLSGAPKLTQSRAYQRGWVEPQDLSVQLACARVDWPEGAILDYCAGGGGKALAIAAATGAPVDVHDANPKRMADLPARAARAGATLRPMTKGRSYDAVLTDVPCSGSGTWRRDPEAKWRLTEEMLANLVQIQDTILDEAAQFLRPGGQLIYMTCSIFHAENEARIAAFLERFDSWTCRDMVRYTPPRASDGFFVAVLQSDDRGR